MVHQVNLGAEFIDYFAGKGEGVAGRQDDVTALDVYAAGAGHVIEHAGVAAHVVVAMGSHNVFVVRTAVQHQMTAGGHLAGGVVVGGLVGAQHPFAIDDFGIAMELVNIASSLLLARLDGDLFPSPYRRIGW